MARQEAHSKLTYKPKTKLEVFFTGAAVRIARDNKHIACACGEEVKVRPGGHLHSQCTKGCWVLQGSC